MEIQEFEKQLRNDQERTRRETPGAPAPGSRAMTLRERFQRTMHYQKVDSIPNFEFGYWDSTLERWRAQGLPEHVVDEASAYDYFGIENWRMAGVSIGLRRVFEPKVLEETETRIVQRDAHGVVSEINRDGERSIPHFLEYPVRDRETWRPFRENLLDMTGRVPEDWPELAERCRLRDYPLGIWFGSLIGMPRNIIGFENIAMMVYEQPDLLEEIVETFCVSTLRVLEKVLPDVQFDFAAGWEDICFNSGPIVGVQFFQDVLAPRYKRITDLLRLHGVDIVNTDCDGNLTHVMPSFLAGGVNTAFPVEVHAGTDPVALRGEYGRELRLWGGVDKMIFLKDRAAVDAELQRLRPVVEEGGFIPGVDHRVQADASLDLYKHYLDRKREWFGAGGEPKY